MKICIISSNYVTKNRVGGFASMTRTLARALAKKGYEVVVLVPKKYVQEKIDEPFEVIGLSKRQMLSKKTYRIIDADIYHSQNQSIMSAIAMLSQPQKKHVITCRDPRNFKDWLIEFSDATFRRRIFLPFNYCFEEGLLARWAVQRADIVGVPAYFLKEKVKKQFCLKKNPLLLPNIEKFSKRSISKAKKPTVIFIGRLDKRKRPRLVFELAKQFPEVTFHIVGTSEEKQRYQYFLDLAKESPNIAMHGFLDNHEKKFDDLLSSSWILINTSSREGLPITFIEAASRNCAILSYVNPDNFASKFGYHAKYLDFKEGLTKLLSSNSWKEKGKKAHKYVEKIYDYDIALKTHIEVYKKVLK